MEISVDPSERRQQQDNGFVTGLASAILGATVLLIAPIVAILAIQIWAYSFRGPDAVLLHATLARVTVVIPIPLILGGLWFGLAGLRSALRARQSAALPVAGLLLSFSGLFAWVFASVVLLNTMESLIRMSR